MLKRKILTILGFVMITALIITIFAAYSYADPVDRSSEAQEYEGRHNHHGEELDNDPEAFYHHHHQEIEEDRYYHHCCH